MPCIKVKGGYKIRRSKGGLYPKIYKSLKSCKVRVQQMETHKKKTNSVKLKTGKRKWSRKVDKKMRD